MRAFISRPDLGWRREARLIPRKVSEGRRRSAGDRATQPWASKALPLPAERARGAGRGNKCEHPRRGRIGSSWTPRLPCNTLQQVSRPDDRWEVSRPVGQGRTHLHEAGRNLGCPASDLWVWWRVGLGSATRIAQDAVRALRLGSHKRRCHRLSRRSVAGAGRWVCAPPGCVWDVRPRSLFGSGIGLGSRPTQCDRIADLDRLGSTRIG